MRSYHPDQVAIAPVKVIALWMTMDKRRPCRGLTLSDKIPNQGREAVPVQASVLRQGPPKWPNGSTPMRSIRAESAAPTHPDSRTSSRGNNAENADLRGPSDGPVAFHDSPKNSHLLFSSRSNTVYLYSIFTVMADSPANPTSATVI